MQYLSVILGLLLCYAAVDARKVRYHAQFLIQLYNATFETLSQSTHRIIVVDPDDVRLTSEQNEQLKSQGKTVLAYLSVGQAEDFRSYWMSEWSSDSNASSVFVRPDPKYPNGIVVQYWTPEWKAMLIDYVANDILPYNYSGLLMDYLQTYDQFTYARPNAAEEMVVLAKSIIDVMREADPYSLIIAQDSMSLWDVSETYRTMIDGVGAEMVWFDEKGQPRNSKWTQKRLDILRRINNTKKMVFAEEYMEKKPQICSFYKKCALEEFACGVFSGQLGGVVRDCEI